MKNSRLGFEKTISQPQSPIFCLVIDYVTDSFLGEKKSDVHFQNLNPSCPRF
jgi:hypothetical protein